MLKKNTRNSESLMYAKVYKKKICIHVAATIITLYNVHFTGYYTHDICPTNTSTVKSSPVSTLTEEANDTEEITTDSGRVVTDTENIPSGVEKAMTDQIVQTDGYVLTKEVLTECADQGMTLTLEGMFKFDIVYDQEATTFPDVNSTHQHGNDENETGAHAYFVCVCNVGRI